MQVFNARDLLTIPHAEIWEHLPDAPIRVQFDDGVIDTHARHTILSFYCWWPQMRWSNTPLLMDHHIGNRQLNGDTILELMERSLWLAADHNPEIHPEVLSKLAKEEIQRVYNDFTYNLEEYVTSINALHFIEVLDVPEVRAVNDHLQSLDLTNPVVLASAKHHIADAQDKLKAALMRRGLLRGNRLMETVQSGIYSIGQILQCVGPRGLGQDIDGNVFDKPIMHGFAQGINQLHDSAVESRSAALALMLAKAPLSQVEYFNREMQLVVAPLCNLYRGDDCGTTEYTPWTVQRDNLKVLVGLYYKMLSDGPEVPVDRWVKQSDTHLIGKTILLRTALTCNHADAHGVCGKCFGRLARSVPDFTNIGHVSVVELCARVSQNVLSTKHLVGSAIVSEFVVQQCDAPFIKVLSSGFNIGLNSKLDLHKTWIIVDKENTPAIADITLVSNIEDLSIDRISQMNEVIFEVEDEDGGIGYRPVMVGIGQRQSSFSVAFLKYLSKHGYDVQADGSLRISLAHWDHDADLWTMPRKHASMLEFLDEVKSLVKTDSSVKANKGNADSVQSGLGTALVDFHDMVAQKFPINITHLAIILRATMIRSASEFDYRLPAPGTSRQFGRYKQLMRYRSLAAWCAHQEQSDMPEDPASYLQTNRPWHPFDVILVPPQAA